MAPLAFEREAAVLVLLEKPKNPFVHLSDAVSFHVLERALYQFRPGGAVASLRRGLAAGARERFDKLGPEKMAYLVCKNVVAITRRRSVGTLRRTPDDVFPFALQPPRPLRIVQT